MASERDWEAARDIALVLGRRYALNPVALVEDFAIALSKRHAEGFAAGRTYEARRRTHIQQEHAPEHAGTFASCMSTGCREARALAPAPAGEEE